MDIGVMYLSLAFTHPIVSAVKDARKTRWALMDTGKPAVAGSPVLSLIFIWTGVVSAFVLTAINGSAPMR